MNVVPDYNLLSPLIIEQLLKTPMEQALGSREITRINKIQANYDYYNGKQHYNKDLNVYMYATDDDSWEGRDYPPSRYWVNHFKTFIKRKSRWQMAGKHSINVIPSDDSTEQIEHSKEIEGLLYELWEDNEMDSIKMQVARERLIAGSIACKLSFNQRTGKLHWIWHKATEVFPRYSDDGFEDFIGCDIIKVIEDPNDPELVNYVVQRFDLDEDTGYCYLNEHIYNQQLEVIKTIQENVNLGFDFIPIVIFDVQTLATERSYFEDIEDMKIITKTINEMMEDASDSLKFEMFAMTVIKNADLDEGESLDIAPGAVLKVNGVQGMPADVETVETSFKYKETFKDQYNRLKSALHEQAGLPQITPTELNFGGMNDRALQVLYQEIIQETQEHWLMWEKDLRELFEKSVRYLQARSSRNKFKYDKKLVDSIGKFRAEMSFQLPLPDDRHDLVSLLKQELELGLESKKGAMKRLGVKSPDELYDAINEEIETDIIARSPYDVDPVVNRGELEFERELNEE